MAILAIFIALSFPKLWLIAAAAILEEAVHLVLTHTIMVPAPLTWALIERQIFAHWSVGYLGFNLYPWILFPLITVVGEVIWHLRAKSWDSRSTEGDIA